MIIALFQILAVATIVFALLHIMPGDPVMTILGSERTPDPAVVEAVRQRLGLDRPLPVQYGRWLFGLARFDLGTSLVDDSPVWEMIQARLPRTVELVLVAVVLGTVLGLPMGVVSALRRNHAADWIVSALASVGIAMPVYVIGTLFVLLFAVKLRWVPSGGYVDFAENPAQHIQRLLLPAIALSFGTMATIARITRSSMLEVLHRNYVMFARAKGLSNSTVIVRHALRTALVPVVTLIGLQIGTLLGGSVLVEYIFNWPGLSTLLINSVNRRDYPMAQGVVLVTASMFILINLTTDIIYGYLDPRIRRS